MDSSNVLDLGSIENYGSNKIDVASDFVAQYTTRQQYRNPDVSALDGPKLNRGVSDGSFAQFTSVRLSFPFVI